MQHLRTALVLLVALLGLYLSVPDQGISAVVAAAGQASPRSLAQACGLLIGVITARVLRFHLLLCDARPSWSDQVTASGIGFFALQLLPFRLGELVRPHLLAEAGVPWGRSLVAIAVERLLDLVALLVLVVVSGSIDVPGKLMVRGVDVIVTAQHTIGIAVLLSFAVLVAAIALGQPVLLLLRKLPGVGPTLASLLGHAVAGLSATGPGSTLAAAALTAWVWGSNTLLVATLLAGFPGLPTGMDPAVFTTAATTAGILAVPTPGMVGSFEAFATQSLELWSAPQGAAAAFALCWHALTLALHAGLGASLLAARGMSLTEIVRSSRSTVRP